MLFVEKHSIIEHEWFDFKIKKVAPETAFAYAEISHLNI